MFEILLSVDEIKSIGGRKLHYVLNRLRQNWYISLFSGLDSNTNSSSSVSIVTTLRAGLLGLLSR